MFCCCLVRRSDPKERRLGKRPSEEHYPERKFCRNGPHQARTTTSRGIADSIKHVSGETRRDGQCRKTMLSQQAPDRIGPACQRWLDGCTQDISGNVPRRRNQGVEVVLRHALQNDLLTGKPLLKEVRHIERQAAVHLLERSFSIHKARVWTNIPIVFRFVDQIPDGLDIRIAAVPEVAA